MTEEQAAIKEGRRYRHVMSRYDLLMASVGTVIGSGWLFGSYYAAKYAGPASLLAWAIGGILFFVIELPFAEMATMFPEAGAPTRMPQLAFGSLASSMTSWVVALGGGFGTAIECLAVVRYASAYVPGLEYPHTSNATPLGLLVTAALMMIFLLLSIYGIRLFARTVTVWTTVKWVVPSIAMVVLIIAGLGGGGGANFSAHGGFMPYGFAPVFTAVALGGIIYAYSGPRSSMALAAEGANPKRDVPFALLFTVGGAFVLYTLLQVAFILAMPQSALANGWAHINFSSPLAQLAFGIGVGWLGIVLYVDAILSPSGTGLLITGTASRALYAIDKNGFGVPTWLKRLNTRGIPLNAQWAAYVVGLFAIIPLPSWHSLIELTSAAGVVGYMLSGSALGVFRRTAAEVERPFTVGKHASWLGPLSMAIASSMYLWFGWPTSLRVGIYFAVGLLLYFLWCYPSYKLSKRDIRAGIWLPCWLYASVLLSWLGSFGTGNLHVLPFPLDQAIAVAMGIVFYYWAVRCGYETDALKQLKEGKNVDWHGDLVVEDLGIATTVPHIAPGGNED